MDFVQQNLFLILLAVISGGGFLVLSLRQQGGRQALTPTQATLLINRENALVIDVRELDEYVGGHIPDSRNFPLDRLPERAGELERQKDLPLILVCQNGGRSGSACDRLSKLGFSRVHNLNGGISGWRAAGLPLKKGTKK